MANWLLEKIVESLFSGIQALADYLSLHVLLCLIPAFFIAGAMAAFIPKEAIVKYMGKDTKKIVAYPIAAIAGLLLAVCSCTVLPLFAGIKKKGAGLGPAITFLFSAPAVNILAITYTGVLIGMDIAIARLLLALVFSIVIGLLMELIFQRRNTSDNKLADNTAEMKGEPDNKRNESEPVLKRTIKTHTILNSALITIVMLCGVLLAFMSKDLLNQWGIQHALLLQMVIWSIGVVALVFCYFSYKNKIGNLFITLLYILFTGTSQITFLESSNSEASNSWVDPIALTNMGIKAGLVVAIAALLVVYLLKTFDNDELREWMDETWDFVKKIFPYIIIGVFLAGIIGYFIPPEFIKGLVGENTVVANAIGVSFGIVAYFPTLMEVPIARMFLDLGMSRGVLLAYLLADPELSLQSILVVNKYIGLKKNLVYVGLVFIFTILAGLLFGLIFSHEPIRFI